jgi:uncharacterized membrane protein YqjE
VESPFASMHNSRKQKSRLLDDFFSLSLFFTIFFIGLKMLFMPFFLFAVAAVLLYFRPNMFNYFSTKVVCHMRNIALVLFVYTIRPIHQSDNTRKQLRSTRDKNKNNVLHLFLFNFTRRCFCDCRYI